jgi:serine/threonine protein kinase
MSLYHLSASDESSLDNDLQNLDRIANKLIQLLLPPDANDANSESDLYDYFCTILKSPHADHLLTPSDFIHTVKSAEGCDGSSNRDGSESEASATVPDPAAPVLCLPAAGTLTISGFGGVLVVLAKLASLGRVHRDVRPSNLTLCGGKVFLIDFGFAVAAGRKERFAGSLVTGSLGLLGKLKAEAGDTAETKMKKREVSMHPCDDVLSLLNTFHLLQHKSFAKSLYGVASHDIHDVAKNLYTSWKDFYQHRELYALLELAATTNNGAANVFWVLHTHPLLLHPFSYTIEVFDWRRSVEVVQRRLLLELIYSFSFLQTKVRDNNPLLLEIVSGFSPILTKLLDTLNLPIKSHPLGSALSDLTNSLTNDGYPEGTLQLVSIMRYLLLCDLSSVSLENSDTTAPLAIDTPDSTPPHTRLPLPLPSVPIALPPPDILPIPSREELESSARTALNLLRTNRKFRNSFKPAVLALDIYLHTPAPPGGWTRNSLSAARDALDRILFPDP